MSDHQKPAWEEYISKNWFLNILMVKIRIKSCPCGIPYYFLLFAALLISVCRLEGSWDISGDPVGLKDDYFMFAIYLLLILMSFGILSALNRLESFLQKLPEMVSSNARPTVSKKVEWIKNFVMAKNDDAKPYRLAMITVMLTLFIYMQILVPKYGIGDRELSWSMMPSEFPVSFFFASIWTLFWLSLLANFIWYCLSMAFATWWTLREYSKEDQLVVVPLAPDGKGGLSSIGDVSYAISLSASSGVIGLIIWMKLFGADLYFWIGAAGYGIVLLTLFFIPLMAVHQAMATARENELKRLSNLFMAGYRKLREYGDEKEKPGSIYDPQLEESAEYLSNLNQLYSRAEAMPVWPFEAILLVRLIVVALLPFIAGVLQGALAEPALDFLRSLFVKGGTP